MNRQVGETPMRYYFVDEGNVSLCSRGSNTLNTHQHREVYFTLYSKINIFNGIEPLFFSFITAVVEVSKLVSQ